MNKTNVGRVFIPAVLALTLVAAAAGCGSGGGTATTATTASQRPTAADQVLQYARCMRAHGVNVPDPNGENAPLPKPEGNPAVQAAHEQCRRLLPTKMQGNAGDPGQYDNLVALARCLRGHGVNVADPQPGQSLSLPQGSSHNQRVQDAIAACDKAGTGKKQGRE